ncbi:MAG: hypothetical protein H0Z34_03290 [Brevibacillus sp.]|nr:hypothetical protein [Brevibacillus sp.]
MNLKDLMSLLPQQAPFRFVDEVTCYRQGQLLEATFTAAPIRDNFGHPPFFPETCLMEGLAQATVIFTQLETEPLREGELPLLGSIETRIARTVLWNEQLTYQIRPIRMMKRRAILEGAVYGRRSGQTVQSVPEDRGSLAATAVVGVVIASSSLLQQEVRPGEAREHRE